MSFGILNLIELGEVSFGILKLGNLGKLSFLNLGELGTLSFGILKLGEFGHILNKLNFRIENETILSHFQTACRSDFLLYFA